MGKSFYLENSNKSRERKLQSPTNICLYQLSDIMLHFGTKLQKTGIKWLIVFIFREMAFPIGFFYFKGFKGSSLIYINFDYIKYISKFKYLFYIEKHI